MNEKKQIKTNLERVKDWIAQDGLEISGMVVKEMNSRCCPFHFCEKNKLPEQWQPEEGEIFIEVNPDTSKRTLRKHYKKDIVSFLRNIEYQKVDEAIIKKAKERGLGDVVAISANQHSDPLIRVVASTVKEIVKEDYRMR